MSALDSTRFEALSEFLRDCPGRLSVAIVADMAAGQALVDRLQDTLAPLPVERTLEGLAAHELGGLAQDAKLDRVLVLAFIGPEPFGTGVAAARFWQELNHQRERLATEPTRVCFVLDPPQAVLMASAADDLFDWAHVFDFTAEAAPVSPEITALSDESSRQASTRALQRLREQWSRARLAGFSTSVVTRDFAWPLFVALVEAHELLEAQALWEQDLRQGTLLPEERRAEGARLLSTVAPDSVTFIHLSNFLFHDNDAADDAVRRALLADLTAFAGRADGTAAPARLEFDFVVITGDVAYSAQPAQYARAENYLRRLCKAIGVPPDRVFVVPGNHDVDRLEHEPALAAYLEDPQRLTEFWSNTQRRRRALENKLAAYRAFARRLNPTLVLGPEQPGGFLRTITCRKRRVAVLGLSSAWLGGDSADYGRLLVGREQILELLQGERIEADLRLALVHHPRKWLRDFDQHEIGALLERDIDLLLNARAHGDATPAPPARARVMAVGSLHPSRASQASFNIVRVMFGATRTVTCWLRGFDAAAARFGAETAEWAEKAGVPLTWDLDSGSATLAQEPSLRPYLMRLVDESKWLSFPRLPSLAERRELDQAYVRPKAQETNAPAAVDVRDLLVAHANIVLLGGPGSGKTTVLRDLAHNLARALLGDEAEACLERIGWQGDEPPLPILVRLADFSAFIAARPGGDVAGISAEHYYAYLDHLSRDLPGLPVRLLRERVRAGGCWLLFDGLDEVPGEELRAQVAAVLEDVAAAGRAVGNRHVVTSRTPAYVGHTQLGTTWARAVLADFDASQVEAFVRHWSRAVFGATAHRNDTASQSADAHAAELLAAIRSDPQLRALATQPLLLTFLAVVHWQRRRLPEPRAELLGAIVNGLLDSRERATDRRLALSQILGALALALHDHPDGVRRSLDRAEAARIVAQVLNLTDSSVLRLLEAEMLQGDILVGRVSGTVEFAHLAFAEYLAAEALARNPNYWERLRTHLYDPAWGEVVLLLAQCLRRHGQRPLSAFISRILAMDPSLAGRARAVGLVGRILRDVAAYGGDAGAGTGHAKALRECLVIFELGSVVAEKVRVEVGEALGQAGDPRVHDDDHANRVFVPAGAFSMGTADGDDDERPIHKVVLADFFIDRHPVTVAQYRRFVEAGDDGYFHAGFWQAEGWHWRERRGRTAPGAWDEQVRHPNRPVTGVTWYEADAYCSWLAARSGWAVSLPTEAQWEFLARGASGRRYPWGDEAPTDGHANFAQRIGHPTPVGIYPLGATPEGVQDLAGNVYEWCRDGYGSYPTVASTDAIGPAAVRYRVLRGGAYDAFASQLRGAARRNGNPLFEYRWVGFRCVVAGTGRPWPLASRFRLRSWAFPRSLPGNVAV